MKRLLLTLLLIPVFGAHGATETPISALPELTTASADDALAIYDKSGSTYAVKRMSFADFKLSLNLTAGSGTVTSIAMTVPNWLSVSGSPITTSGTLAITAANQNANLIFAGPATGSAAAPTFRSLVAADIPSLSSIYQPLDADLTSWATITRASGFDAFAATPSGANLASLLTSALPLARGGTGQVSAAGAINALVPSQAGNAGYFLRTTGSAVEWFPGGGGGSVLTGRVAWVDSINGTFLSAAIGSPSTPYATITAARNAAVAAGNGTCVVVLPGTYDEQIVLTAGLYLYFYPGAIVNYTGNDATFTTIGGAPGQVKIHGAGRFYHTGNAPTAIVFYVGTDDLWHIDVECEDVRTIVGIDYAGDGHNTLVSSGTTIAAAADLTTTTPAAAGNYVFAIDTREKWVANSTSEGDWSVVTAAAVYLQGGYIKIHSHSLDGVNCDAIRWLHGSADIQNDRTTATGPGCAALDMGATEDSTQTDQVWLRTLKLSSDQNERAFNAHGFTNNPVGGNVLYIESQGIYGAFYDTSNGLAGYIKSLLILPAYGNGYTTTQDYLINLDALGSFYQIDIGDIVGDTASGTVIRTQATFLNGRVGRIESFSGKCIEVADRNTALLVQRGNGSASVSAAGSAVLHVNNVRIAQNTTVADIGTNFNGLRNSLSFNCPSIAAGSVQTTTISVAGADTNGMVIVQPTAALPTGLAAPYGRVTATGTVTLYFPNPSAGALDPASMTYNVIVQPY